MSTNEATERLSLLMVVAHPHDFTHMAGTCAHHIEDGDSVTVVAITGGGSTHNERLYDELRKRPEDRDEKILAQQMDQYVDKKMKQFCDACAIFGITDARVLPFTDVPLRMSDDMVQILADLICEVRPHIVMTHAPDHPVNTTISFMDDDHVEAGRSMRMAMRLAGAPDAARGRTPHHVVSLFYMGMEFPDQEVNYLVDITDQAENRLNAEMLFTTQAHTPEFARKRLDVEVGHRGWNAGTAYAEPFVRAQRQVGRKLSITKHNVDDAEAPRQELLARRSYRVTT